MGCRYCQSYYRAFPAETLAASQRWDEAIERIDDCLRLTDELEERLYSSELHLKKARYLQASGAGNAAVQASLLQAAQVARDSGKHRTETEALVALQALALAGPDVAGRLKELAALRPEMSVRTPVHAHIT
ncbi:hypothetical protein [Variovorax sp. E3]|uniref:hypothetical protein n=1 Tax=Variovorax sp. E3 TaxID=1914993 RepID=UPI0022B6DA64|nr:hypothetical protein [Variovorax sp. E3]